ncbi:hypothetical protein BDF14DRAFT_326205 [Spinellus fusiger]|nr:hypothetical protein BDF14DRAFT_326205 [Spinellus fusiger]
MYHVVPQKESLVLLHTGHLLHQEETYKQPLADTQSKDEKLMQKIMAEVEQRLRGVEISRRHTIKYCKQPWGLCGDPSHTRNGCQREGQDRMKQGFLTRCTLTGVRSGNHQHPAHDVNVIYEGDTHMESAEEKEKRLQERYERRSKQLEEARKIKQQNKEVDKEALEQGQPLPSQVALAKKINPMMIKQDGHIEAYDIVDAMRDVKLSIPLHQL